MHHPDIQLGYLSMSFYKYLDPDTTSPQNPTTPTAIDLQSQELFG
jgi:hypothetical protein